MYSGPLQRQPSVYYSQALGPREVVIDDDQSTIEITDSEPEEQEFTEEDMDNMIKQLMDQQSPEAAADRIQESQQHCTVQDQSRCPEELCCPHMEQHQELQNGTTDPPQDPL